MILCSKIDNCQKIDIIKDKDILDFQFAESVKSVCGKCKDFTVEKLIDNEVREKIEKSIQVWCDSDFKYISYDIGYAKSTTELANQILSLIQPLIEQAKQEVAVGILKVTLSRIEALQQLLICYRVGKNPTETLFSKLDVTEKKIQELKSHYLDKGKQ